MTHDPQEEYTAPVPSGSEETAQATRDMLLDLDVLSSFARMDHLSALRSEWVADLAEQAASALRRTDQASCPHAWQPIATAPKDREFLSFDEGAYALTHWYEGDEDGPAGWYDETGARFDPDPQVWMSLPAPPVAPPAPKGDE